MGMTHNDDEDTSSFRFHFDFSIILEEMVSGSTYNELLPEERTINVISRDRDGLEPF